LLTEIIVQDIPCVVFDDPVNSLDDKIISKFSDRIIELSKMRQIVIFTHNKYFQKTLEESIKNI
jgi:wobble nucleotide-excising tRNase